ncbi:MAG: hypothetical protein P8Y63_03555 [Deltaproteobacteria bacterium]|jgi:hypothetical protein
MDGRRNLGSGPAAKPTRMTKAGCWDILFRVKDDFGKDNLSIVATGVVFIGFLALMSWGPDGRCYCCWSSSGLVLFTGTPLIAVRDVGAG